MWRDLPLVNYALYAVGIAHAEISNLPTQRLDLVLTAVFPMLVPWVIYGLRWSGASQRERWVALGIGLGVPLHPIQAGGARPGRGIPVPADFGWENIYKML